MRRTHRHSEINVREMCVFAMLGSVMFASKMLMEMLPNIHLLGMLTVTYTIVYRERALIPIYLYVFLDGLFHGFNMWWIPYLYIWTILWGVTLALPQKMSAKMKYIVYSAVCSLHGFLFGILYAPAQALMWGLTFEGAVAWVIAGLPYDLIHGISNLGLGLLIVPLAEVLEKLSQKFARR